MNGMWNATARLPFDDASDIGSFSWPLRHGLILLLFVFQSAASSLMCTPSSEFGGLGFVNFLDARAAATSIPRPFLAPFGLFGLGKALLISTTIHY